MFCKYTKLFYIYKMNQISYIEKQQIDSGFALFNQLADRSIKLAEMDVAYNDYRNWLRHGLLIEEQTVEKNSQLQLTYFEYLWIRMVDDMSKYGISYKVIKNFKKEFIDKTLEKELLDTITSQTKLIAQLEPKAGEFFENKEILEQNKAELLQATKQISTSIHLILFYAVVNKVNGSLLINQAGKNHIELDGIESDESDIKCSPHLSIPISYILSNYLKIDDVECCMQLRKPLSSEENKLIKIIRGRKFGELESISIGYKNGEMDLIKVRELKRTVIESRLIDHIQKGGYHNIEYKVQGGSLVHFVNERVIKV